MSAKSSSIRNRCVFLTAGLIALAVGKAGKACEIIVSDPPSSPGIVYDVYAFERAFAVTDLMIENIGETSCALEIVVEDFASAPPPFALNGSGVTVDVTAPGLQRPQTDEIVNGIFSVSLEPGQSTTVDLDFFTEQYRAVPAGVYSRELFVNVREPAAAEPLERFTIDLSLTAIPRAQVNIAGAAGVFGENVFNDVVDFGEPEPGETRRVFVQTRANAPTIMRVRSENGGVMKHETIEGAAITYTALLGGQTLDLSEEAIIENGAPTDLDGISTSLDLTIDSLINPFAGAYSDRIIFEIEAQ